VVIPKDGGIGRVGLLRATGFLRATGLGGAGFLLATGFLRVVGFFCAPLARLIISCISSGDGPREEERGVVLRTDLVAGRTRRRVDRLPTGVFLVLLPTLLDLPPMINTYQKDFVRNCSAS
jgi:hypothetical protein